MTELAHRNTTALPLAPTDQGQTISGGLLSADVMDRALALGRLFAASGYFAGVKDEAKAFTKIAYGLMLKVEPMAALQGIWEIQGKLEPSAQLRAAIIRASGRYDYEQLHLDETSCSIEFFGLSVRKQEWKSLGVSEYTIEDAKRAKLAGKDTWVQHTEDMLWSAAMRKGARKHCPDLFVGDSLSSADDGAVSTQIRAAQSEAPAALPTRDTTTLPAGDLTPEIERRKRRVHVLARDLGWDDDTRHRETAKLFDGRMSLNDLDMDELGQLIEAMATRVAGLTTLSEPKPPLATAQDNPLADVHLGPELSAYDRLVGAIDVADPAPLPRGQADGITAQQTGRLLEIATAAGISDVEMMTLCLVWSSGVSLQDLTTDAVTAFGLAVRQAVGA